MDIVKMKAEAEWFGVQGLKIAGTAAFGYACGALFQTDRKVLALACAVWQAARIIFGRIVSEIPDDRSAKDYLFILSEIVINPFAISNAYKLNIISTLAVNQLTLICVFVTSCRLGTWLYKSLTRAY